MNIEEINNDLTSSYNHRFKSVDKRVKDAVAHLSNDLKLELNNLNLSDIKSITTTILNIETSKLKNDVESLLAQKEVLERSLEKKAQELQESKYSIFNAIENSLENQTDALSKLHQVKLQSIDLYDMLSEMVESAIITALEKDSDGDIAQSTEEVIKDITYEAIKEGSLNTIRVRKILSTILQSSIDIAEATPTKAQEILNATLRGMRSGLIRSIDRFKKRLAFMPVEAKHILIEDYDTIMEDLNQSDTLFSQVIQSKASEHGLETKKLLLEINKNMRYDLQELVHISKETADLMRERFSSFAKTAVKKADTAMKSQTAQEAKRMGKQALEVARIALGSALKTAKDAIDKDKK
ncbi:DUF6781 family protein [Sulfurimonas sp.]|uniref:DUF6781 family protein n=1 Tax=Sulfurimonas sp. TaxID=2022749 RepID=UPI002B49BD7B|nr:DUF6781 family protein [Sulfurimonas sp.]